MSGFDEFQSAQQVEQLRQAAESLQRQLTVAKHRNVEIVEAVHRAAYEAAMIAGSKKTVTPKKDKRDKSPEVALWHMTDWQGSKVTTSYNSEVMKERVRRFVDKATAITDIQRSDHPVRDCTIMFGGDMVEGLFNFPCVDTETEALTPSGWKKLSQLDGEKILVFDPETDKLRYETPLEIFSAYYEGPMHHYVNSKVDHVVTPHHRMYVKTRKENSWNVRRSHELSDSRYWVKTSGSWSGGEWNPPPVARGKYGKGWGWGELSPTSLAAYIGWFITEGHARYGEVFVSQSLSANPDKWEVINILHKEISGYVPRLRKQQSHVGVTERGFTIASVRLSEWMQQFKPGDAATAQVPDWLRNAPAEQLEAFLDAVILGDGHYNKTSAQIFTISERFANDLVEISAKLGYSTHIGTLAPGTWSIRGGEGMTRKQYVVTLSKQERTVSRQISDVDYHGTIWCPRVSTGLWMSRRNGKVIVTGNTQPFEIDSTIFEQYVTIALLLQEVVTSALEIYENVTVVAEWGNHGRIGSKRDAVPKSDNIDRMSYELARRLMSNESRLTWQDCPEDIQRVEIGNYRALLMHGDEVGRAGFASPAAWQAAGNRWKAGAYAWDFLDIYLGHYHKHAQEPLSDGLGAIYWTGSTESDNRYARDSMAASGVPSQRLHFVDPDKGRITATYQVWLDT